MEITNNNYSLFCVIVDFGIGNKILKTSKKLGATGGTFFLGKGTVKDNLLDLLGINEVRKEILIMIIDENLEETFINELTKKFLFNKPNHGIAFSMPLNKCFGIRASNYVSNSEERGVDNMRYEAIFTIVDKGLSDSVLEAAESAGSTGGTIIHGRGSGSKEKALLFNIEIEPEKEIILILSAIDKTDAIVNSIKEQLGIDKPGAGIIFVLDVNRTSGLLK